MYATAVGLLMNAIQNDTKENMPLEAETVMTEQEEVLMGQETTSKVNAGMVRTERKSIFDKWSEKLKDFLDNAE